MDVSEVAQPVMKQRAASGQEQGKQPQTRKGGGLLLELLSGVTLPRGRGFASRGWSGALPQ